jgi:DNA polymerase III alpha subunit (gram-positive type)
MLCTAASVKDGKEDGDTDKKSSSIEGGGHDTRPKFRHLFIAFDLETTGLRPETDEILQIGASHTTVTEHCGNTKFGGIESTKSFSVFLKVQTTIPQFITELTGITQDMASSGHSPDVGIRMFFEYLGSISSACPRSRAVVLCSWNGAKFDIPFLDAACRRIGLDLGAELKRAGVNCHVDMLEFARRAIPRSMVPHPTIKGRYQYTLGNVHRCLTGHSIQGAHTATQDALAVLTIIDRMTPWYTELQKDIEENIPELPVNGSLSQRLDGEPETHNDKKDGRGPQEHSERSPSFSRSTTRTRGSIQDNIRRSKERRKSRRFSPLSLELA